MTHKIKQHTVHSDQTKGESTLLPRPIIFLWKRIMLSWFPQASCFQVYGKECYQSKFINSVSLFSQWYFTLSGWSRNKNLWEIVASSPFPPPLAASPLAQVFSRGLLCSLSRLASLAITGELAHRLMKIRHCVPGIKLIQCTGLYSIFF